jgi:uncharacterized membrane protein YfcA
MNYYLLAALIGLVGGITSGMFGVGGGVVMVPAMLLLMGVKSTHLAVGTSLAVIVPTAIVGALNHHRLGNVDWRVAAYLAPAAIIGGFIGPMIAKQLSSGNLKKAFGAFLILVGFKLLLGR